jgi:hypothetical protein
MRYIVATNTRRITHVVAKAPSTLHVKWKNSKSVAVIDLAGWIATGDHVLAPLRDSRLFESAHVGDYGASIEWHDDENLAIDAHHLSLLAEEQRPFDKTSLSVWQKSAGLSNAESAALVGVALSTWNSYKAGAPIPSSVAIALRAATRDPLILQAHLRPSAPVGRPRKQLAR